MIELGGLSIFLELNSIVTTLSRLEDVGSVESVPANGTVYYRQVTQFGFRPPRN